MASSWRPCTVAPPGVAVDGEGRRAAQAGGILFARLEADAGIHPDWYQVTWHTEEYVRRHWASILEIRGYLPGAHGAQDIVIGRKAG